MGFSRTSRDNGRVVVLHGYGASPSSHWFPWLRLELGTDGIDVDVPRLPDTTAPKAGKWIEAARAAIGTPTPSTVVVAHSLGTITALKALEGLPGPWSAAGLILVAPFDRPLPTLPELDDFTRTPPDYRRITTRIPSRHVLVSSNDTTVAPGFGRDVAARAQAVLHTVTNAGHFCSSDGFTRLPLVAELVRSCLHA